MTQDRLLTSLNWRPMVGSAVATMVWSSAARNIVSNRLIRMVRTSSGLSGAGGAIGGASLTSMTSVVMRESSRPISSGNVVWSAGSRPCRWCLFMSDVIFFCAAKAAEMESPYAQYIRGQIPFAADACAHGCIPRETSSRFRDRSAQASRICVQAFGRFFSRARFGNSAGHCTMWSSRSSSAISSSVPCTLPRTETPASCTVLGSPEISGCHQ